MAVDPRKIRVSITLHRKTVKLIDAAANKKGIKRATLLATYVEQHKLSIIEDKTIKQ